MKLLSKVVLAIALLATGAVVINGCTTDKPITPPEPNPQPLPDAINVTFKVGNTSEIIKVNNDNQLVKQPAQVTVPEGKEFKGWKIEGTEDSTATKQLPLRFERSVVYVAVFGDVQNTEPQPEGVMVTFKVGETSQVIKVNEDKRLQSQPDEVQVPEGKEFVGWKVEGTQDSTATKQLPEMFESSVVYVAVFGDAQNTEPQPEPAPTELKEVTVDFTGMKHGGINFSFQITEEDLAKTKKINKKDIKVLKEYYLTQLLINGENREIDKFDIKIDKNQITFFNLPTNYNDEVILKKGTIFKTKAKEKVNNQDVLIDLAKSANEIKLRYDGTKYIVSDVPLSELQNANDISVNEEEITLSHEVAEGVTIEVGLLPEGSVGSISASLEQNDDEITVEVSGTNVIVKTLKMPVEDYTARLIIKLNDTDVRKVVTIKISKVEQAEETYTVTFELNGGTGLDQTTKQVQNGQQVTQPTQPTKEGHTFAGWFKDMDLNTPFDFSTETITASTTIYAKWTQNEQTVTFNLEDGQFPEGQETSVKVLYGNKLTKPTNPTKENFVFKNWYKDEEKSIIFDFENEMITSDLTLYVKWEVNEGVTLTLNLQGGQTQGDVSFKVPVNTAVEKPSNTPTKEGYTFVKWVTMADGEEEYDFNQPLTADKEIFAKWQINTYQVTFELNQGTLENNEPKTVNHGESVTKPEQDPTREGYDFAGWYKDQQLETQFDFATEKITSATTIYAKWTAHTYTVTFVLDGGTLEQNTQTINHGEKAQQPQTPTKEGYTFAGWYTNETKDVMFNFETTTITSETSIYAKWTIKTYEVRFMVDNGELTEEDKVQNVEHNQKAMEKTPTKEGYDFGGWYTEEDLTNKFDFETLITEAKTLYPKWTVKKYTVTYVTGDDTFETQSVEVNHDSTVTRPTATPKKEGHTFQKWVKTQDGDEEFLFDGDKVTSNISIYAKFVINQYDVTFVVEEDVEFVGEKQLKVNHNEKITKPQNPTKEGYTFVNWYEEQEFTTVFDFEHKQVIQAISIYAKFEKALVSTEASNTSENDQYSPLVLSFGEGVEVSRDETKENIEDQTVLDAIKAKFTGRTLDFVKYENNVLKIYFDVNNKPQNGDKMVVASELPIYKYTDGSYVLVGKTTNQLDLVYINGNYKNITQGQKTHTLKYKVSSSNSHQYYGYMTQNATVSSFTVQDGIITTTYTYNQELESILKIYNVSEESKNQQQLQDETNATLVHNYKLGLFETQTYEDNKNLYTQQGLEEFVKVTLDETKHNVLVIFATKQDLYGKLPRLHYWGFEQNANWDTRPSLEKVSETKPVYSYLISSNKTNDTLGFIVTKDTGSKFTSNVESSNEKLSTYFQEELQIGKLKVIIITSDRDGRNDNDLEGVGIYTGDNFQDFLNYLN